MANEKPFHITHVSAIGFTAEKFLVPQAHDQQRRGAHVGFVFSPGPETERLRADGFDVDEVVIPRGLNPVAILRGVWQLRSILRSTKPDLVHTHTSMGGLVGRLAGWLAGVPVVHTIHGFPFADGMHPIKYAVYVATEWVLAKLTLAMMSQSEEDIGLAARFGIQAHRLPIQYIGNGISLSRFSGIRDESRRNRTRSLLGVAPGQTLICIIGRVNTEKGYPETIEALAGLPEFDWKLISVGFDEGLQARYQSLADSFGVGARIEWLGLREDIPDLLEASDLFILASHREGVPRSLIEAQAQGVPSIATAIRGCREVIVDDETGLLVPAQTVAPLRGAIARLLNNPLLAAQFAQAGRRRVHDHFDENLVCQRIWDAYLANSDAFPKVLSCSSSPAQPATPVHS